MKPLVDISVLFPARWQAHVEHQRCRAWIDAVKMREGGWHLSAETFLGALRLMLNPASTSQRPLRIEDALRTLRLEMAGGRRGSLLPAVEPDDVFLQRARGHRQVMDFYQVQLAAVHGIKFATRDRGVAAEWPQHTLLIA